MTELTTKLMQLADRLATQSETDAPTDIALAVERLEELEKRISEDPIGVTWALQRVESLRKKGFDRIRLDVFEVDLRNALKAAGGSCGA